MITSGKFGMRVNTLPRQFFSLMLASTLMAWALMGGSAFAATTITQWTLENLSVAVNNSPAPSTGSGTATPLAMNVYATPAVGVANCDVKQGAAGDTGANTVANLTKIWRVVGGSGGNGW